MIKLFFFSALSLISLATIFFFFYSYRQRGRLFNIATFFLFFGTVFLALMLLFSGLAGKRHPSTSSFETYNFLALLLLIIYFVAEYKFKIRMLGTFFPPFALFFNLLSVVMPNASFRLEGVYSQTLFSIHTAFSLLGEASFALSFVASVMYIVQDKNLRAKKFKGLFFRLSSLSTLEKTANFSLLIGFPFLTVGVLLGFLLAADKLGGNWLFDPKIIWTMITWIVYSLLFMNRVSGHLRGKRFALFLIISFLLVVICYWVANYFSSFHNFIYAYGA
ncbi:MAG: inner membrane protein YpjD [Candidatus Aminicenantales bacterium]